MPGTVQAVRLPCRDALSDAADPRAVVRFSYAAFKAKYGETIFGSAQPKRALEAVADEMYARGYEVKAGVHVWKNGSTQNGFTISGLELDS